MKQLALVLLLIGCGGSQPTPSACDQIMSWGEHAGSSACRACAEAVEANGGACYAQAQASTQCVPSTYGQCMNDCTLQSLAGYCACESHCAPSCADVRSAYESCFVAACASACM